MAGKDTLVERYLKKIKNNRFIAILVVAAIAVGASITFAKTILSDGNSIWTVLFPKKEIVQIIITVKPYDLISESNQTQSPSVQFFTLEGDINVDDISFSAVSKIHAIIQPRSKPELDIEIIKNSLHVFEPVVATISYYQSVIQTLEIREFDENADLNLDEFFQYSEFYNPTCNCVSLYIEDSAGQLRPSFLRIYKYDQNYSFDSESLVVKKSVKTEINPTVILVAPFKVSGTNSETGEQVKSLLNVSLRQELSNSDFIKISALTLEELQKKREELKNLPTSDAKSRIVEQYNVDFVVEIEIIVTNEP